MSGWRSAVALLAALALGGAWAQTLRLDNSGGPQTVAEELRAAIAAWQDASETPLTLAVTDDGEVEVRFATDIPLGPDTLALTLQTPVEAGTPRIEIRLNPDRYRSSPATLLHELGVLLGLQPNDDPDSVMQAAMSSDSPAQPSAEDIASLDAVRNTIPEDVNRDGSVDFYDLAALAEAFGAQGINLPADIDRNGEVDELDLEALRAAYLFGEPSPTPRAAPEAAPAGPLVPLPEVPEPAPLGDPTGEQDADTPTEGGVTDESEPGDPTPEDTAPEDTAPEDTPTGDEPAPDDPADPAETP